MSFWWWFLAVTWCWSARSLTPTHWGPHTWKQPWASDCSVVPSLPPTACPGDSGTLSHLHSTGVSSRGQVIISSPSFSSPAAPPPPHILRRAGKLSQPTWTSQSLTTHYCPGTEGKGAGPLFKDMGNIPNFPTLPALFSKDIHSYLVGNVYSIIYSHFLASMIFPFPVLSLLLEDKP